MATIINIETGLPIIGEPTQQDVEVEFIGLTPLDVYTTWATELGFNVVGSDVSMTGDDTIALIPLQFQPFGSVQDRFVWSSEGLLAFHISQAPSNVKSNRKYIHYLSETFGYEVRGRAYFSDVGTPEFVISISNETSQDSDTVDARVRSNVDTCILYSESRILNDSNRYSRIAVRIDNLGLTIYADSIGNGSSNSGSIAFLPLDSRQNAADLISGDHASGARVFAVNDTMKKYRLESVDAAVFEISGTVTLDGVPYMTDLVVTTVDNNPRVIGTGASDATGNYTINCGGYDGIVLIHTLQEYGSVWSANKPVNLDDVVHPTVPNGYVYRAMAAGATGSTEPVWPTSPGVNVSNGDTLFTAEVLIRPMIEGYVNTTASN